MKTRKNFRDDDKWEQSHVSDLGFKDEKLREVKAAALYC